MKGYENVSRNVLTRRTPVILRVDGRAFHTFTKSMEFAKPFDTLLSECMETAAYSLVRDVQGAKIAYVQSDEISVLITDYDTLTTDAWFGYNIQKMVSIASSITCNSFNQYFLSSKHANQLARGSGFDAISLLPFAQFDARVFNLPREEVVNYFVWRQQDATRNSIQMVARSEFSHKECQDKSTSDLQDMLMTKGINWNDTPTRFKRGFCVTPEGFHMEIPIFTQDREYLERFVNPDLTIASDSV